MQAHSHFCLQSATQSRSYILFSFSMTFFHSDECHNMEENMFCYFLYSVTLNLFKRIHSTHFQFNTKNAEKVINDLYCSVTLHKDLTLTQPQHFFSPLHKASWFYFQDDMYWIFDITHSLMRWKFEMREKRTSDEFSEVAISLWNSGFLLSVILMAEHQRETKDVTRTFLDFLVSEKFSLFTPLFFRKPLMKDFSWFRLVHLI